MTLGTPAWLLGLLLVPVIWYLHRSGPVLRRHPVASLDLWQDAQARSAQVGQRRPPDAAWLRRAAILTLLCIALAGPQWSRTAEKVTLWVDDSLSMQSQDDGGTRLDQSWRLAQAALRDAAVTDVAVRPLSDPTRVYGSTDATTLRALQDRAGVREPRPPAPDSLAPDRAHWLLTDGADDSVNAWLGQSRVGRVIQVGTNTRNVGIVGVSVRPQPVDSNAGAVQIRLRNGGVAPETRVVELSAGPGAPLSQTVSIAAGASLTLTQHVRLPLQQVQVRLAPADALPQDDAVVVDGTSLAAIAVRIDPSCPVGVTRSIAAHPALRTTAGGDVGLIFDCGSLSIADALVPRVALRGGTPETFDAASVVWSQAADGAARPDARFAIRALGRLEAPRPLDEVLVAAGNVPLVIRRAGSPRVVETSVDVAAPELKGSDAVPLLMAFLADAALNSALLDRSASFARDETASMVAPLAALQASRRSAAVGHGQRASFVLPFLVLAVLLLSWDAISLARRLLRDYGPRARVLT